MSQLFVRLIQANLFWEDKQANLDHIEEHINASDQHTDVIILPEMFTSGFTLNAIEMAEDMNGPTLEWMSRIASQKNSALCGSIIISENDHYYNRFIWMNPDGNVQYYDKRHLFTFASEEAHYSPGKSKLIINFKSWKICPLICYDLRFPVWSRNTSQFDLLIYVANWPSPRAHAWKNLLISRAIENQCYTIGVNRVGEDANDLTYLGDSCVVDYNGIVLQHKSEIETSIFQTLDKNKMLEFRKNLNFLADQDLFNILP
jgi:predicted amidohydrolase